MAAFSRTSNARAAQAASGRSIAYILSTSQVARDNHTIDQAGWKLDNYRANNVCLWCHDSSMPPIGRVTNLAVSGGALRGDVEYAEAATYDFADTIFRLVKGGFMNAVSVSWNPIKFSYTTDRARPGGIDFKEQELLEVSQVPVPCDTGALATARARGISTAPLALWAERALDERKRLSIPRQQLEELHRSARVGPRSTAPAPLTALSMMKASTPAERLNVARFEAYECARKFGIDIPARHLPARTECERVAIVSGLRISARSTERT